MEPQAVLFVASIVMSIFNVQLGNPIVKPYPMPTMETCQEYAQYMQADDKLDLEYMLLTRTQCVTMEEFQKMQAQQLAAMQGQGNGQN